MGLSSKKTKTTQVNKPVYAPQIEGAANAQQAAYNQSLPGINQVSSNFLDLSGDLLEKYREGDPAINAARNYVTTTLEGDPAQNPYLNDIISQTNDSVRNQIQAAEGTRGRTGGSAYYDMIGRALAQNETGLRYTDYNNAQQRRAQAAGLAPGVAAGDYLSLQPALQTGQAGAMLPLQAALANSAGVGGLLGQYQDVKGTQKTSGGALGGLAGSLLSGWASGGFAIPSDARLKENVRRVGKTDGGLTIYTYNYKGHPARHMGVMAQEVAKMQPGALGPEMGGYKTVNYGEVR